MLEKTTTAMLQGLTDPDNDIVWREFDARYRPVIERFVRRMGLPEADASDVTQDTLLKFLRAYRAGSYDRERGRLSSWIIKIARNCACDMLRARAARGERRGASAYAVIPGENQLEIIWREECRDALLEAALARLRSETRTEEQTIRIFEMLTAEGLPAQRVAQETGVTLNDVYLAKHRCLKRLRSIVADMSIAYELE